MKTAFLCVIYVVSGKLCPCKYYNYKDSCYYSSDNDEGSQNPKRTFNAAKTYCQSQGGHLVTLADQEELNFVVDIARKYEIIIYCV